MAPEHLPGFLPGPDGSDPLFTAVVVVIVLLALLGGVLYFKLHAVPEHVAHRRNSGQMQLVAVLAILALLTHNNAFWVAALLFSVIRFPDLMTPIRSIDQSLKVLAGRPEETPAGAEAEAAPPTAAPPEAAGGENGNKDEEEP